MNTISHFRRPKNGTNYPVNLGKGILGYPDSVELWTEILSNIPDEILLKPDLKILVVASGHGTEATIIADRMINLGIPKEKAQEKIYLLDKYMVFLNETKYRYGFKNLIQADFIEWEPNMKFDVIVGNPPYQENNKDGTRKSLTLNLWSKFWYKCIELSKDHGYVSLITPTSWCSPSKDSRKKERLWSIFEKNSAIANIDTVSDHFRNVGSTFGYVVMQKGGKNGLSFIGRDKLNIDFMPLSGGDRVQKELDLKNNIGNIFRISRKRHTKIQVSVPISRRLNENSIEILDTPEKISTTGSKNSRLYFYINVNTMAEAKIIKQRIIDCLDILNKHCRFYGFLNFQTLKYISYEV